ncbi:MAG: ligase [Acidimicrobiales bacterium]|jgi:DNA ligase-1|nr:ligase [Acidimicrobiales bacterium]
MLFADLVATSAAVTSTSARSAKVAALADLLGRCLPDEVAIAVPVLTGAPRQGKIGVGWRTAFAVEIEPATAPTLTVHDVDDALDALAETSGTGSAATRAQLLAGLFSRATADEGEFLRRLLVGELRQGALAGVMTEAVARAAGIPVASVRRAAMFAGDLSTAAVVALTGGAAGLDELVLRPLHPVLPMLAASSPTVADAVARFDRSSVEWKLDGIRVQAHRAGDDVRLFTRNLNDVTDQLPAAAALVRSLPADSFVLDGEAVGGDLRFFDCLHVDGAHLVDHPLVDRLAALELVAGPWRVPGIVTADAVEAERFLHEAIAAGHEGVMVKDAASPYEAGRRGASWRKVKPVRTLDLVVLAVEWGSGRRRGWLSNIHLGARAPDGSFLMVGKTFKGMTDEMLRWQTETFQALQTSADGQVVHLRPEIVVEIALDGVHESDRYPGGVGLRFARVKRYRPDKRAAEADTIESIRAMLV